jgi:hypothetical protein
MSFNWLGSTAKLNLIPSPLWRGGVIGEYIAERDDVDNNKVDKLRDVDTSVMLGGFFGLQYNHWSANIEAMQDVADGNDGAIIRLNGGYTIPIDEIWALSLGHLRPGPVMIIWSLTLRSMATTPRAAVWTPMMPVGGLKISG